MSDETPDQSPMSSPINDVRKLKANSSASADELMQWLTKMRGKSPQEVLGAVASSGLFKSTVQGAFLLATIILVWTAAAWGWDNYVVAEAEVADEPVVEEQTAPETTIPDNVANPETAKMPEPDLDAKQKVAEKLGIGEVKEAPVNFNPLDDDDDDLLKELE